MLYELVDLAGQLQNQKKLPPASYKPRSITWLIDLTDEQPQLLGPFKKGEYRAVEAPDRQRSGKVSKDNVKPYLLLDDARYVLGIPEDGKSEEAQLMHEGFTQILEDAYEVTGDEDLARIIDFCRQPIPEKFRKKIKARHSVTFQTDRQILPFEKPAIQNFWKEYLSANILSEDDAECSVCGEKKPYVRYIPNPVIVYGQSCQLTSFNKPSFVSMGKSQTNNVPVCFSCSTKTVDTLNYLIRHAHHHATLVYKERDTLHSEMAVYWLDQVENIEQNGISVNESVIASLVQVIFDEETKRRLPPPELGQLQELIWMPRSGREQSLRLDQNFFHMGILSANKGRLVIREWIDTSVLHLLDHLKRYVEAIRIVHPTGEENHLQTLPIFLQALESSDANLVRQMVRTIYQGYAPPKQVQALALDRFRLPKVLTDKKETWRYAALASLLKLSLTYGKEEAVNMETLNLTNQTAPYLCGRLLAVLEEIQQRATGFKIGSTIVQRYYGAASTAPSTTFGPLLRLTTTAHLPKVSVGMARLLEAVMKELDQHGGFPPTLSLAMQAEFALGFYHQRAEFSSQRQKKQVEG